MARRWATRNPDSYREQENHYYPFGMNMEGPWREPEVKAKVNRYQYNGKELNSDLGLGWYNYGARWYDAAVGRWNSVDPLADEDMLVSWSPYHYGLDNPVRMIDPDGQFPIETIWDIGNVLYDVGAAIVNHVKGDHKAARSNWVDAGMDVGAVLIPYVPAGTTKLLKAADKAVDAGKAANKAADAKKAVKSGEDIVSSTSGAKVDPKTGQKIGPSGKPMVHTVEKSSKKEAKDAARNDKSNGAKGTPAKHTKDEKGGNHYHNGSGVQGKGKDTKDYGSKSGKISNNVHYKYPKNGQ